MHAEGQLADVKCASEGQCKQLDMNRSSSISSSVWRILANEFGERFSYYGLRAVLTLYFVSIGNTEAEAVSLFAYTSSLAYFMPMIGGVVADVCWGRYFTIIMFSIVYISGSLCLSFNAFVGGHNVGALLSLLLISIGTGGIKPCVSAFGADQLNENDATSRSRYFSLFYMSINAGSTLSFIVTPLLRVQFGFAAAFFSASIVLAVAVLVFFSGRNTYRYTKPASAFYVEVIKELRGRILAIGTWKSYRRCASSTSLPDIVGKDEGEELEVFPSTNSDPSPAQEALQAVGRLLPILCLMPCFWALFDQQGSAWVIQAKSMNLSGVLPFGWDLSPEMIQILNPIFILILVPLATRTFEKWPRCFCGSPPPRPLQKMCAGMVIAAFAFIFSARVQRMIDTSPTASVSILWQIPQLFLITLAEVLVSVISLDYFYAEAPVDAKAFVSALALFAVSVGDLLCGVLYHFLSKRFTTAQLLLIFAVLMLINAGLLFTISRRRSS